MFDVTQVKHKEIVSEENVAQVPIRSITSTVIVSNEYCILFRRIQDTLSSRARVV